VQSYVSFRRVHVREQLTIAAEVDIPTSDLYEQEPRRQLRRRRVGNAAPANVDVPRDVYRDITGEIQIVAAFHLDLVEHVIGWGVLVIADRLARARQSEIGVSRPSH